MLFVMLLTVMPDLVQLGSAVSAEKHPGENRNLAHRRYAPSAIAYLLHYLKHRLLYNCLMGILEDLPLGWVVFELLFVLVGLAVGLEIHRMPKILLPRKHMHDGAGIPNVLVGIGTIVRRIEANILRVSGRVFVAALHELLGNA